MEQKLDAVFNSNTSLEKEQIKSCLGSLLDYSEKTKNILNTYLELYFTNNIKGKIRALLLPFVDEKYNIGEKEYTVFEQTQLEFVPKAINNSISRLLSSSEAGLTEENFNTLSGLTMNELSKEIEAKILLFKYTLYGALKLDVQIRSIIVKLSEKHSRTREIFQRISQIVMLLNIESIEDLGDVYKNFDNSAIRLKLTGVEIKRILSSRYLFFMLELILQTRLKSCGFSCINTFYTKLFSHFLAVHFTQFNKKNFHGGSR
jgi:hypothetical protein